ncbi:Rv3654c family TadE-like protein [Cellulomonas sp.]|uniref:Rv3654c family TadE-like protein n=1 Tax=Cellulomonas sp. TaxID=40001 RepID=UPI001B2DE5C4|nr:Rv3654c family TadE-like protein [Cellulomonas sp.]MBO9555461.1 flp pilus-assembly TadE/G-like family protein [Cellulomonas sp.]
MTRPGLAHVPVRPAARVGAPITAGVVARVTGNDTERGSGTVLLLGIVAVVLMLGVALSMLVSAQVARARAQSAADLAALAGAAALRDASFGVRVGTVADPCAVAAEVVRRNRARLRSCDDEGAGVLAVGVSTAAGWGTAVATARAGPLSADGSTS